MSTVPNNAFTSAARSYGGHLRVWLASMVSGYFVGAGLIAVGVCFLLTAVAIGSIYAFRMLEILYGTNMAFLAVGGAYGGLAVIFLVAGSGMLTRAARPAPSPYKEIALIRRDLSNRATSMVPQLALSANRDTKSMAALGLAGVLVWLASRSRSSRRD